MKRLAVLLLLAPLASACASVRAQTPVERPALEVPPVPPRVIEPMPTPDTSLPEPVAELPAERTTPRPRPPQRDTAKPENKPAETAPPVDPPAQPVTPSTQAAVPPLRTGTTDKAEARRQVQEVIDRAKILLGKVVFNSLSAQKQALHKNVEMFIAQADDALKEENFDLARKLADKAETIAKELQNR